MNRKQRRSAKRVSGQTAATQAESLNKQGLALVRRREGEPADNIGKAIDLFTRACLLLPAHADAHNNLGASLHRLGRYSEAIEAFQRALTLQPDFASAFYNWALALKMAGRLEEAVILYRRALTIRPDDPGAYNNLGIALNSLNRQEEAEAAFRAALSFRADDPEAYSNLGAALVAQGKLGEGADFCRKAIILNPATADAHSNLSSALFDQGRFAEAARAAQTAVRLLPDSASGHNNLGVALQAMGRLTEAEKAFRTALLFLDDFPAAHYNLATTLLQNGQYLEGWRDYEWRWKGAVRSLVSRQFAQPCWNGEDLRGQTLLLHGEQGLGDILQFARYAIPLAARGARVVLEVYRPLARLLGSVPGVTQVVTMGDPLPAFDIHLPMMSAPRLLCTTVETIPADVPYIIPEASRVAAWAEQLAHLRGLKVGLVWSGDPRPLDPRAHATDRRRSMSLRRLTSLLSVPGANFVSLQKGSPAAQLAELPAELRPFDPMDQVTDFADTAALIANLDLVIAVDTSVAHLAGAMGKPVWIASRYDGCWRWLMDREDSPWYPTARLFRQAVPGDWSPVIDRLTRDLEQLTGTPGTRATAPWPEAAHSQGTTEDIQTSSSTIEEKEYGVGPALSFTRAVQHHQSGRLTEAEVLYRAVLDDIPDHAASLYNLGLIALGNGRADQAVPLISRAVAQKSDDPHAHYNLGVAYHATGRPSEAANAYERALDLHPSYTTARNNLGAALMELGQPARAAEAYRSAIEQQPDYPEAHYNLGTALLKQGAFAEGWHEFEWRFRGGARSIAAREIARPLWQGEDLAGRTILLHAEQGFGDALQFARYAPLIARRGARVILEVHRPLTRLLATIPGISRVVALGEPLEDFDYHLPLMSAPRLLETTVDTIPAAIPYISANTVLTTIWHERLATLPGLKVGLVWAGEPRPDNPEANAIDRRRSIALARMAPLLAVPRVSFVSLQKGAASAQKNDVAPAHRPHDWMDEIGDFADTAALVANLDLVITVDTAVAHLAGALGKPVWILSRFDGCWRWLEDRDDTPWYPSARLFRQKAPGDWDEVIARVAAELERRTATPLATSPSGLPEAPQQAVLFNLAFQFHQTGKLAEAESLYRSILSQDSRHAGCHYNLGLISLQKNDADSAVGQISRALELDPTNAEARINLGSALQSTGRLNEALTAFQSALDLRPDDARVHFNLGVTLNLLHRPSDAIACWQAALSLAPAQENAYANLALCLTSLARLPEAVTAFVRATALQPDDAEIRYNCGLALQKLGKLDDAQASILAALDRDPRHARAHGALGAIHLERGRPQEAEACCRAALAIASDNHAARSNLAAALFDQGRFQDSLAIVKTAIALRPDFATAYQGLAVTLQMMGRAAESRAVYRTALLLAPDHAMTHYNMATALLQDGDYPDGWREFEWRWRKGAGNLTPKTFAKPLWNGEDLSGRTLLLHGEQGLGDILQFVRFASPIAERGARIILEVPAPLKRLLAGMPKIAKVIVAGETLPDFDYHLPMMSAPGRLGTTLATIPADIPYISADSSLTPFWSKRLAALPGVKVGLVWSGNPRPHQPRSQLVDGRRSMALTRMAPLLGLSGVSFVSLQKGAASAQRNTIAPDLRPHDWMDEVGDFADTAALVANLDLVITVDTSVAHLAGAMGKPVWILSRYDGCWRWLEERDDSPWYPTARLFRQKAPGDWDEVIARVVPELKKRATAATKGHNTPEPLTEIGQPASSARHFAAPQDAELFNEALRHHQAGHPNEAAALYRRILDYAPRHTGSLNNLGLLLLEQGHSAEAAELIERAVKEHPDDPEAHYNLGVIFQRTGQWERAAGAFERALKRRPGYPEAQNNLGSVLVAQGKFEAGETAYRTALAKRPDYLEAQINLGTSLFEQGRFDEAVAAARTALQIETDSADAHNNLGVALLALGRRAEAETAFHDAILHRPDFPKAHCNLAAALLKAGRYPDGFRENEWRWNGGIDGALPRSFVQPRWAGQELTNRTILLYGEQGLGDVLQFARFAALFAARGATVVLDVYPPLKRLLATVPGVSRVISTDEETTRFDYQLPLMSAPHALGTTLAEIPAAVPYVTADATAAAAWGRRLAKISGLKVGLVWSGNPRPEDPRAHTVDSRRSMRLTDLTPLLSTAGITFVSLQKGPASGEIGDLPSRIRPLDWMGEIGDFADTAALVANLDLVISVDTSVAHLAGAMGKPVWIASRFDGCWRWLEDRDDSPWYPSARLFRQKAPGDWTEVVARLATELERLVPASRAIDGDKTGGTARHDAPPPPPPPLFAEALRHHKAGRLDKAERLYRRILKTNPEHAASLNNLGLITLERDRPEEASDFLRRALRQKSDDPQTHYNLGVTYQRTGRIKEAIEAFGHALEIRPDYPEANNNLGILLVSQGALDAGAAAYLTALAASPTHTDAQINLSTVRFIQGRFDEAVAAAEAALHTQPASEKALNNLGIPLLALGRLEDAEKAFRAALSLRKNSPEAHYNLGTTLLRGGHYGEGWREYEWRWKSGFADLTPRPFSQPLWTGQDLSGRTILLYGEQGFGDVLQFARYAPLFAARGARVILEAYRPLTRLLTTLAGVAQVVSKGEALPAFDYQLPLISAPFALGTTLETIPAAVPYLTADPALREKWRPRLADRPGLKVGLVWAGNPKPDDPRGNAIDRRRSIELARLAPLLSIPGVTVISLQKGTAATQTVGVPPELRPLDWMDEVGDFADTAALVANLDLVITVDTSVAHLAGALGKPVWILSRFDGCWRWLVNREDSPWYPTARLFRQKTPGAWDEVIARVAAELTRRATPDRHAGRAEKPKGDGKTEIPVSRLFAEAVGCFETGRLSDAAVLYRRILAAEPDHVASLHHLGLIALRSNRLDEATALISATIALGPDIPEAYNNLGIVRTQQGALATGACLFHRAVLLREDYPAALSNWGSSLGEQERWDDAVVACRQAVALQPDFANAYSNLGVIHSEMGRPKEAETAFRIAIRLSPGYVEAQYNLGTTLLLQGHYQEGWSQYEWRLRGDPPEVTPRTYAQPLWTDEDLAGRTILLYGEQGLGDLLQFSRYASLFAGRGARVVLEAYPPLRRLLATLPGVDQVVSKGEPLPPFDYHLPIMSAPHRFGTTLETIPARSPYLAADPARTAAWGRRLTGLSGLKVGLVWSGDPRPHRRRAHVIDRRRSMALSLMAPLLELPGISFISLQKGAAASQLADIAPGLRPHDWMDEVSDFADTAALVANLDLVITVDTSVAHLAGAIGKPVWILSRFDGCWRWLEDRDDSPWYPTARLFRQRTRGDWTEVLARVAAELEKLTACRPVTTVAAAATKVSDPEDPSCLFAEALQYHRSGRLEEAEALYRRVLDRDPGHFDSLHHLGLIALWSGDATQAVGWISQAIMVNRHHVGAHVNLGRALSKAGRIDGAVITFRMAVALAPEDVDARYHLGIALHDLHQLDEAIIAYRDTLALKPDFAAALTNLGGALGERERREEAITACRRALTLTPEDVRARSNLGACLHELHRVEAAIETDRQTIALAPDLPETHYNLAIALLRRGDYEEGWREYEWRWKGAVPGLSPRQFAAPLWTGDPLAGRTILLHGEQGLGDGLQFARYASLLAGRGARVLLEVPAPLTRLLSTVPGVAQVIDRGNPLPAFDCHLPLMSAPLRLNTRLETIPANVPYVSANSQASDLWRKRLSNLPGLKVGLVWAGDPRTLNPGNHAIDRRRSLTLGELEPLLAIPGITFVSLQKGEAAGQIRNIAAERRPFDAMDEMEDFADTAALVANLDLVVAVDTSVAHLAGAMGKPVWIFNRFNGCWRWLDDRESSPWYPSVRLFRQEAPGDWTPVIERVATELRRVAEGGRIPEPSLNDLFAEAVRHHQEGRLTEADDLYRRILAREPRQQVVLNHRGIIAQQRENPSLAVAYIRQALCIQPSYMEAWTSLATALRDRGEQDQAEPCLLRAIQLRPDIAEAHNNLGSLYTELGRLDDAVAAFRKALSLQPDHPEIHCNLAAALLKTGRYEEGWREHEWRLHPGVHWAEPVQLPQPVWTGEDLSGRTILLRSEQGLGDDLQFSRFAAPIAALGAKVILEVPESLTRLLSTVPGVSRVVTKGEVPPDFDYHLSLMSAPGLLGTTLETIPADFPYVTPDEDATAAWKKRLARLPGLKVGLVWAGDPRPHDRRAHAIDRRRSMPLAILEPLLAMPGVSFISLQKGEATGQTADIAPPLRPLDWMDEIADFADTAALVANLDLVISVDTSVVHLAGAMGKPVWIASRYDGCWRWLKNRDDSPWYPAVRLFRQKEPGNWQEVVSRIAEALKLIIPPPPADHSGKKDKSDATDSARLLARAVVHHGSGRLAEAEALYRRILALSPDNAFVYHHLGLIVRQAGNYAAAERLIGQAVTLTPDYAEALNNLGAAYNDQGKTAQAIACCRRAVILKPDYAKAHNNLGKSFKDLHDADEAARSYRRAVLLDPQLATAYSNLGAALLDQDKLAEAIACCEYAQILAPEDAVANNNRSVILTQQGDVEGAIHHYRRAVALDPGYAEAHANLGMALLHRGDFTEGWREYEWRLRGGMRFLRQRPFPRPQWNGEAAAGQTILLHAEQGLGDALQFARYATPFARRGMRVILEVQAPLRRLLATIPGVSQVVTMGGALPAFDCHLSLMSAPLALGTTVETVPAAVPYVTADAGMAERWAHRLAGLPGLKVGLVWAGNPRVHDPDANRIDRRRSMTLSQMTPLLRLPGVTFITLQKGGPAAQLADIAPAFRPHDWMDEVEDFADTAALVANLDLVITVDTAVAHLAGAMGKPVWIASRFDGCWRWLEDRDDSPWYPSARLFRQKAPGDWTEVVARMADALRRMPPPGSPGTDRAANRPDVDAGRLFAQAMDHHRAGRLEAAVAAYRDVIARDASVTAAYINLAVALMTLDRPEEAIGFFREAIAIDPHDAKCHHNLGQALTTLGKIDEAVLAFQNAVDCDPFLAKAQGALGAALIRKGRPKEALAACRTAIRLSPDDAEAHANLAAGLFDQGRFAEAVSPAKAAIALRPDFAAAYGGLALVLHILGRAEEAEAAYRAALVLHPDDAEIRHNLAMALLRDGHYAAGFREYEWRWRDATQPQTAKIFSQPLWAGEDLTGKTLLLWGEQGLGDVLQFVRYGALIAERGARVILEVHPSLAALLEHVPGVSQVVPEGDALPAFDFHLPMLSAPRVLGTTLDTVPATVPYLWPDDDRRRAWRQRLADWPEIKVGLVWAGNPRPGNPRSHLLDARRSVDQACLAPLLSVPGIRFISLQKGAPAAQLLDIEPELRPYDWMDEVEDFADTAALVANLDLVITVDTAVAHLAGAMGKPVWILSRFDGCWRWLKDRDDSPWYPTARLFRQKAPGDWDDVVGRVAEELRRLAAPPSVPKLEKTSGEESAHLLSMAIAHHKSGDFDAAEEAYRQALSRKPGDAAAQSNLGCLLRAQGRAEEALALHEAVARRFPRHPDVQNNLGVTLLGLVRPAEAIEAFRKAVAARPDDAGPHVNLAHALLLSGQWREGWRHYEWRWKGVDYLRPRPFPQPQWSGEDIAGRTILLHAEQGLGDTLQFVRYAALIADRGARVVLEAHPPLKRLLASVPGVSRVVSGDGEPLPPFDVHLPLLSAPGIFDTTVEAVPAPVPYLTAEPALVENWRARLSSIDGLKVGLVWAGAPWTGTREAHAADGRRSIPLARMTPLLECPGVRFVSLQKGRAAEELRGLAEIVRPLDWMNEMDDFADTAALVANLDLVISVDTSVAHLAGAMGKPVWIASRFDGCWRWLEGREDSPWYPTARLFRQTRAGDWNDVIARLVRELTALAGPPSSPTTVLDKRRTDSADTLFAQAVPLLEAGRLSEAEALFRRLLAVAPGHAEGMNHLGLIALRTDRLAEAARWFGEAIAHAPDYPKAYNNLGIVRMGEGEPATAARLFHRAITLKPDYPAALSNWVGTLAEQGRWDEATLACRQAVTLQPDFAKAYSNLGVIYKQMGRFAEAETAFRTAIRLSPDDVEGQYNLGTTLLLLGRYEEGWAQYEWRLRGDRPEVAPRTYPQPPWAGEDLAGRTILLYGEQGLGDVLQFSRYATLLAGRGARVVLEADPLLKRLLATLPGVDRVVGKGDRLPAFDCHLPMMSAPYRLGTTIETIPAEVPYLTADPTRTEVWNQRLTGLPGLKVGLAWAGAPWPNDLRASSLDRSRSMPLSRMAPLLAVPGVSFVSLQKGTPALQLAGIAPERRPHDWMSEISDFAETAALIANLDLVITVDTSVAHLAGAMGKPVWILVRFDGCWRWLKNREDSPWYPTARLFRQTEPGDWGTVIGRLVGELANAVGQQPLPGMTPAAPEENPARLFSLAVDHHREGRLDEARALYLRLLESHPDTPGHAEAACNLGLLMQMQGAGAAAAACFRRALTLRPGYADALNNAGRALNDQGDAPAAATCYQRSLRIEPNDPRTQSNLGVALQEMGRPVEAVAAYRHAIALQPDQAGTHYNLAQALLLLGEYEEGWREHEWLWMGGVETLRPRSFAQPRWDGAPLAGKTILLHAEQGLGDALQFARYATLLAALGGRVLLEVHPPLVRLLRSVSGVAQVIAIGTPLPSFDCHLPLMAAPYRLGTRLDTIPAAIPYIAPEATATARWEEKLRILSGMRVGLVWAGDPRPGDLRAHAVDRRRSVALADLTPLLNVPGVSFVSLQKGKATGQIGGLPQGLRPHDWMDEISDFADTAALVANLDLIITVDTAVAHLAGAMGKPVWILSRFDGCWRWLKDRDDSPWYPTARLFRQPRPGDWSSVIERISTDLKSRAETAPRAARKDPGGARLFAQAVEQHQAGRLDSAAALYRRILADEPGNIGCLYHLGLIAQQQDRHADAVTLLTDAAARHGRHPGIHDALGTSLLAAGRGPEAVTAHRRALDLNPDFVEACYNLGNAYRSLGDAGRAAACFLRTLVLRPDLPAPYNNLGNLLASEKNFDAATVAFHRAVLLQPADAAAHNNLGNVLKEHYQYDAAIACFKQALHLNPDYAEALYNLGNTFLEAARPEQAVYAFRRVAALRPDMPEVHNNLGTALYLQEHIEEALICYDRTLKLDPAFPEAHSNMGTVYRENGDLDRAEAAYRHAIALDPSYVLGHSNLAVTLLLRGDFAEGLKEFEWRRLGERSIFPKSRAGLPPLWNGEDPRGRVILLRAEQGLGDVLQFCRYAEMIAGRGARIVLEVYPPLKRLMTSVPGVSQVVATNEPLPQGLDWHLPMMSAPAVLGTRSDSIPANIPYLTADPVDIDNWRRRLSGLEGLKVGLVWAGDPRPHDPRSHAIDRRRSIALSRLAPLLAVPGVRIISLQKGPPAAQMADIAPDLRPFDVMESVTDFADTAGLMANLDLMITVDTSVAHLAGAMGKPVWILSRFDGCWRWLQNREDSPWYPSARLFRQPRPGDWDTVIARLAGTLADWAAGGGEKGDRSETRKMAIR
ncbi:tetratricopeptide repeat protein [Telmatospirillum siberiense]|uniref:UDP-N-acetylglucosamine--peptide N-acetylglucosaminyltransferase SPINDLY n=1 Tax=Telmatospirillum siberiense TaxID=382514 RepID=A0A2N3Q035_9PROT|nr:tetratricopeptide repeat protein [Telmatospirillum siberiense]PKU26002.1 hypothetical protein CWS72_02335 [Telmatospirillum siberiense]